MGPEPVRCWVTADGHDFLGTHDNLYPSLEHAIESGEYEWLTLNIDVGKIRIRTSAITVWRALPTPSPSDETDKVT